MMIYSKNYIYNKECVSNGVKGEDGEEYIVKNAHCSEPDEVLECLEGLELMAYIIECCYGKYEDYPHEDEKCAE